MRMWQKYYPHTVCLVFVTYIISILRTPFGERLLPYGDFIGLFSVSAIVAIALSVGILRIQREAVPIIGLIFGMFLLAAMSSIWAQYPGLSFQRTLMTFLAPLGMFVVVSADQRPVKTFHMLSAVLFLAGVILSSIGVIIYIFGEVTVVNDTSLQIVSIGRFTLSQKIYGSEPRISSLLYNPNALAAFLVISIPLTIGLFIMSRSSVYLRGLGIQGVALILTFSRAGLVSLVASITVLAVLKLHEETNLLRLLKITPIVILPSVLIATSIPGVERFTSSEFGVRQQTWEALYSAFIENPVRGTGFGISNEVVLSQTEGVAGSAHSDYFAVLAELGGVGILLFLAVLAASSLVAVRNYLSSSGRNRVYLAVALSIFAALCVRGFAETSMIRPGFRQAIWSFMMAFVVNIHATE